MGRFLGAFTILSLWPINTNPFAMGVLMLLYGLTGISAACGWKKAKYSGVEASQDSVHHRVEYWCNLVIGTLLVKKRRCYIIWFWTWWWHLRRYPVDDFGWFLVDSSTNSSILDRYPDRKGFSVPTFLESASRTGSGLPTLLNKSGRLQFLFFFPWLKHRFQINGTEKNWILSKLELVTPGLVVSMFGFFEWLTHDDPPNWGAFRPLRVISRNENLKIVAESSDFFQQCCLQTKKRWREVAFQDALDIIWIHTFCIILNAICLFIFPFLFWWNFSDLNFGAWIFRCDFWSRKRRMLGEDVLPFIPCWGHHHLCIYALTTQSLWANEMRVLRIYTFDTDINVYIYNMTISTYFFEYRCVCIYIYMRICCWCQSYQCGDGK